MSLPNFSPPMSHYPAPTNQHMSYPVSHPGPEGRPIAPATCVFNAPDFNRDQLQRQHYAISGDGKQWTFLFEESLERW